MSFDVAEFVGQCQAALTGNNPMTDVRDLMTQTVADPDAICAALPVQTDEPSRVLHRSDDLTVLQVSLPPGLKSPVHDHTIWAVIGIYQGQEDNRFFARSDADDPDPIEQRSTRSLGVSDVAALDEATIHAIANPTTGVTLGLHVYGGDLLAAPRHVWDPETGRREPFTQERFAEISRSVNRAPA